jgi:hypothetical protein
LVGLLFLGLTAVSSLAQTGPLAHWRFDELPGATTAADSAGTFSGTLSTSGSAFVAGGRSGNALSLDRAANGFVDCGNILNLGSQNFTISAWVRTTAGNTTTFSTAVSKRDASSANGYFLSLNHPTLPGATGKAMFYAGTRTLAGGVVDVPLSTTDVNDGNWHQVVGVYRLGGTTTIYVDGSPVEGSIASSPIAANTAPFLIGGAFGAFTAGTPGGLFTGDVDDVQVYGRALGDAEIDFLFLNPGQEITATTVTGTVRNAVNGQPLAFASVSVNGGVPTFTSVQGVFTITNVPAGSATITATASGFFPYTNTFALTAQPINTVGFSLSPTITGTNTVRLVLNWGANPRDLDSHLETPNIGGQTHHVYFGNRGSPFLAPFAELDVDDTSGFGPETITISTLSPGTYHYYIHNFSSSPGFDVSGATAQIYTSAGLVATVQVPTTNSTGNYWYVARIDGASQFVTVVNSISATTPVVVGAPSFSTIPRSVSTNQGATVVFSVTATGNTPLAYQWRRNGVNISGANSPTLGLFNVQTANAGQYDCVVSNPLGTITSPPATLAINILVPNIVAQPQSFRVLPGTNVTFNVTVTGPGPFTYQWRLNGANIPGANSASLLRNNIQIADAGDYSVLVVNAYGTALSASANLDVLTPPIITVHPSGVTAGVGDAVNFSVAHTGSLPLTYQWRFNGFPVPGATNVTLNLVNVQFLQAGNYSLAISNVAGGVISADAPLAVNSPPIVTAQPAARTVTAGRSVTFTAGVIGSPPLAYQWRLSGTNLPGATSSNLTFAAAQVSDRGLYSLVITNGFGSVTSTLAFLTVHPVAAAVGWAGSAGGPGTDVGNACAADTNGNFYVAGYFTGTATFGTNTLVSAGLNDIFVIKYNNAGTLLWARRAGGPGYDAANGITVDDAGNTYVTGSFEGTADFGTNALVNANPSSYSDLFVTKLDPTGTVVWARGFGADSVADVGNAITLDPAGNVLVAGSSALTNFGGQPVLGAGRIFLAKLAPDGTALWARTVGVAGFNGVLDTATGVGTDTNGNVHLAGNFAGPTAIFDTVTLTNRGVTDGFLARFDSNGVFHRVLQIGGPGTDHVNALAVSPDGITHVGGDFTGSMSVGVIGPRIGAATASLTSRGQNDGFVAQFDTAGALAWVQTSGGTGPDSVRGLALGTNGTVHVTGFFSGAAAFGTNSLASAGATLDLFTANYTSSGALTFVQQGGGADLNGDFGNAIAVDSAGNSFVTGQFSGTTTLGPSQPSSGGGGDVFAARFNAPQMAPPPVAVRVSNGQLILSWPVAAFGWGLQNAPANPVPSGWQSAPHTITVVGDEYVVTIPLTGQAGFFRLVR